GDVDEEAVGVGGGSMQDGVPGQRSDEGGGECGYEHDRGAFAAHEDEDQRGDDCRQCRPVEDLGPVDHCGSVSASGRRGCGRLRTPPYRSPPATPIGKVPVGGYSRASTSTSAMRRSNPTALWVSDSDRATAMSARMIPSL